MTDKRKLFGIGIEVLERRGWTVERVPHHRSSSVRRITKGAETKLVAIQTNRDQCLAYGPDKEGKWTTLADVDLVVSVTVDDVKEPREAWVHIFDADEVRERFYRHDAACKAAGLKTDRGWWLPLYREPDPNVPTRANTGIGLKYPPVARVPLSAPTAPIARARLAALDSPAPLTIAEAKARLAAAYGVPPENVRITIEA